MGMKPYRMLITGSRTWADKATIRHALMSAWKDAGKPEQVTVVSGACPKGADAYAEKVAKAFGWAVERHPADWKRFGPGAGPIRNMEMAKAGADICLAFRKQTSIGTVNCIGAATKLGIPVQEFYEQGADA